MIRIRQFIVLLAVTALAGCSSAAEEDAGLTVENPTSLGFGSGIGASGGVPGAGAEGSWCAGNRGSRGSPPGTGTPGTGERGEARGLAVPRAVLTSTTMGMAPGVSGAIATTKIPLPGDMSGLRSRERTGMPCLDDGAVQLCFGADPALEGLGACKRVSACASVATGRVALRGLAETEVCDFADNDCDGDDEGVSPCGNCDKFCAIDTFGPGSNDPFNIDDEPSEAVETTDEGWVTLSENAFSLHFSGLQLRGKHGEQTGRLEELARYSGCSIRREQRSTRMELLVGLSE